MPLYPVRRDQVSPAIVLDLPVTDHLPAANVSR